VSSLPRLLRVVDGYHQFEVSTQQYELIDPGYSGLSARQILDRLLGII
jgi:hypothetical protein